jgi:hypothetical protein
MYSSNFEIITSLQYQNKSLREQVANFRSGEKYKQMDERLRLITKEKNATIKRLQYELSASNSNLVTMRNNWFEATSDIEKEHKKELTKKNAVIAKLEQALLKEKQSHDVTKDKLREKTVVLYDVMIELDDVKEKNSKLKAQLNRDHENSGIPSSMKLNRKKIVNNREKTGKKPGGQPGHKGHHRKKHAHTNQIFIPVPEQFLDTAKYKPTGKTVSKQVVNLSITLVVDEYITDEYRHIATGKRVHAAFPKGISNEVTYGGSIKAFAYLLNNHCMVSIDKVRDFLSEITNGKLEISKGMVNGLSREFSQKTESERQELFSNLLCSTVMNVDFSNVKVNGKNIPVAICANPNIAMYFARENKGHKGVEGTPLQDYQGIVVHDHDKTFYSYGDNHQECLAHILRYLKSSIENEPHLTWNKLMYELLREAIHYRNSIPPNEAFDHKRVKALEMHYEQILETAKQEYEYEPPSRYYREGFNLYKRLDEYMNSHLLFLHDAEVPATNNLAERLLRILKRKSKQVMAFRSFDNLSYLCNGMSVTASIRANGDNLFNSVSNIFD